MSGAYFDTSVYLEVLLAGQQAEACRALLNDAREGRIMGYTSGLIPAEIIGASHLRAPQGQPPSAGRGQVQRAREYLSRAGLTPIELTYSVGLRAADLAARHQLKGADAAHVALAEFGRCDTLYSLDAGHLKLNGLVDVAVTSPENAASQPYLVDPVDDSNPIA